MWSNIQIAQKTWFRGMDWRMSDCFWQSQRLLIHPSNFGTANSWETPHFIFNYPWEVNELRIRLTWRNQKERACHLLSEQKIHKIWIQIPLGGKDVLCISLDCSKAQAIPAILYYMVDLQAGSYQVYFWKTFTLKKDCKMASPIVGVWHLVCILESN